MGQVWRATDTTLGRQVAIKILPDAFASDPERLARFERLGDLPGHRQRLVDRDGTTGNSL